MHHYLKFRDQILPFINHLFLFLSAKATQKDTPHIYLPTGL